VAEARNHVHGMPRLVQALGDGPHKLPGLEHTRQNQHGSAISAWYCVVLVPPNKCRTVQ